MGTNKSPVLEQVSNKVKSASEAVQIASKAVIVQWQGVNVELR